MKNLCHIQKTSRWYKQPTIFQNFLLNRLPSEMSKNTWKNTTNFYRISTFQFSSFFSYFFNTIFVSSHMYPEKPEGTQIIRGSMNMGYISDTAKNRTHNLFLSQVNCLASNLVTQCLDYKTNWDDVAIYCQKICLNITNTNLASMGMVCLENPILCTINMILALLAEFLQSKFHYLLICKTLLLCKTAENWCVRLLSSSPSFIYKKINFFHA